MTDRTALSRIPQPSTNGKAKSKSRKPRTRSKGRHVRHAQLQVERWANRYVLTAIALSAGLNGYAAVQDSGAEHPIVIATAGAIGAIVPGLVWGLGKLAGWLHRAAWSRLAVVAGVVGICLLLLSVIHCSASIAALTGSSALLSVLLAIGIDCGLVVSETAAILVHEEE